MFLRDRVLNTNTTATIIHGDALFILPTIPSNSIDALITDPPAGISLLGKHWDGDRGGRNQWIKWMTPIAAEALRVAKPGAHALVWAFPRTSHWTMTAFEDAGWEVHNVVHHLFGQGFPKSKDVSLCIDKLSGHPDRGHAIAHASKYRVDGGLQPPGEPLPPYEGKTDAAKQWEGWGTDLKSAVEHWILFRKPLVGTIASNVLIYGTGAINIDACRVPFVGPDGAWGGQRTGNFDGGPNLGEHRSEKHPLGRWSANLVLSNADLLRGFPHTKSSATAKGNAGVNSINTIGLGLKDTFRTTFADEGSAARYFNQFQDDEAIYVYAPKANKADRNGSRHPTIKGQDLMRWLVRLITPPGGTVLDPFAGSGSTGLAACSQGFSCILIEKELEYIGDCRKRLAVWL